MPIRWPRPWRRCSSRSRRDYAAILAAATTFGKNVLPRVAALLDVQQISEIVEVVAPDTFVRPIYAGNALATVQLQGAQEGHHRARHGFRAAPADGGAAPIEAVAAAPAAADAKFVGEELAKRERPELTAARIVISGGRGLQNAENFASCIEPDRRQARRRHGRLARGGRCGLCAE